MPLDAGNSEPRKNQVRCSDDRRIYVCENGDVRIEEKHFRQTFSPSEFITLLRQIFADINSLPKREENLL